MNLKELIEELNKIKEQDPNNEELEVWLFNDMEFKADPITKVNVSQNKIMVSSSI